MRDYQKASNEEFEEPTFHPTRSGPQREELEIEPVRRPRKSKYFYLYSLILLSLIVNVLLFGGFSFLLKSLKDTAKDVSDLKGNIEVVHKNFTETVKDVSDLKGKINFICKEPGSMCTPKYYVLSSDTASFTEASIKCQNMNMTFASVRSKEEFDALNGLFKSTFSYRHGNHFRLSGSRINAGSVFYWNPSGQLVTNEKWWPVYPVNSDEEHNCLYVQLFTDNINIKLHNADCISADKYVCEYKK